METSVIRSAGDLTSDNRFVGVSTESGGSSLIGGGQIGYNWQAGAAVFGIEADIQWRSLEENSVFVAPGLAGIAGAPFSTVAGDNLTLHHQQNWVGTVRGRLGYAAGRFMPYITGGLAYGDVEHSYTERLAAPNATTSRTIAARTFRSAGRSVVASSGPLQISGRSEPSISTSTSATPRSALRPAFLVRRRPCSLRRQPRSKIPRTSPARSSTSASLAADRAATNQGLGAVLRGLIFCR